MSSIAIITARGGSKRIPRKNIKDFLGRPILSYSIEAALKSGLFDEVMVSTDDEEIADIAKKYGASVPFMRSEKTANDFASTDDVLMEVLTEYKKLGKEFETFACIYPTAPFVTAEKLKSGYNKLKESGCIGVMPVVPFSFPPQRGMCVKGNVLAYVDPKSAVMRSQDLETMYHDAGQFYFYDAKRYMADPKAADDDYAPLVMKETEVQDIDNETDWQLAEMKYKMMIEG